MISKFPVIPSPGACTAVLCAFLLNLIFINARDIPAGNFLPPCTGGSTEIGGHVFRDYNANGVFDNLAGFMEDGMGGVTVKAYDANDAPGVPTATTTTTGDGTYLLTGLATTTNYRIEFTWSEPWLKPGPAGGTTVQFATSGSCNIDVAVNNPADFCQSDPTIFTNCYVEHNQLSGVNATLDVLVGMPYSSGNTTAQTPGIDLPAHTTIATASQVGTTYGLAYQRSSESVFASAFMKRHTGFGPDTTGAIYKYDLASGNVITFLNMNTLMGAGTFGANPHPNAVTGSTAWQRDAKSWDPVGKIAFGDLDISEDELTLWTINLNNRKLYKIPLTSATNPVAPTMANQITTYPANGDLTSLSGINCANNATDVRPFGLGVKDGLVYVGIVCSAESSGLATDLKAFVFSFNPLTEVFTKVLEFPLNYNRHYAIRSSSSSHTPAEWNPWATTFTVTGPIFGSEYSHPQPILTDIVFDGPDMIIGLRDRFGDQMGYDQLHPVSGNTLYRGDSAGDMLRASANGSGGWTIENNAQSNPAGAFGPSAGASTGQGPGEGEFYYQEQFPVSSTTPIHDEVMVGGLLKLAGLPDVAATQFDPVDNVNAAFDGGIFWMSKTDGKRSRAYRVFDGGNNTPTLGKANGLGDLEAMCLPAPLELGNFVWSDQDGDGIQDPGEPGINGVKVFLYKNGTAVDSTITAGGGHYGFSSAASGSTNGVVYAVDSLLPNMTFEIRINGFAAQAPLSGLGLSIANNGGADAGGGLRDSDGTDSGGNAVITYTTAAPGANDHSLDFGFGCPPLNIVLTPTNVTCPGFGDGEIAVAISNGASPFSITWNDGGGNSGSVSNQPSPYTINSLPESSYGVTVTDAAGCAGTSSVSVNANPGPTPNLSNQSICPGGAATFDAGPGYVSYQWSTGETTQSIQASAPDTYLVLVTDNNGCSGLASASLILLSTSAGTETYNGCTGDGYSVTVNGTVYNENNPTGTEVLTNTQGCDSTVTINLVFNQNLTGSETYSGCAGDGYNVTVNNTVYNENNPTGTEVLPSGGGCDSTVTISLVFKSTSSGNETYNGCTGDGYSVAVNNTVYNENNPTGTEVLTNYLGCDSTVTINLNFSPVASGFETYAGCSGSGYSVTVNGTVYNENNPTGTEMLTNFSGCDSIVTISLVFNQNLTSSETYTGCTGDGYSVTVNGTLYDENNPTGTELMTASGGCDSTVTINLVFNPVSTGSETYTGCDGDGYSVAVNGTIYNENNPTGTEVLLNYLGCDSTVSVNLLFNPNVNGPAINQTICDNQTYNFNGQTLNQPGVYTATFIAANGCDSTVTLNLTVLPTSSTAINQAICDNESYTFNGQVLTQTGTYTASYPAANGCDSTVTLNLTVLPTYATAVTDSICAGTPYVFNNQNLTQGGIYTGIFAAVNGCDSTVTLTFYVYPNPVSPLANATVCTGGTATLDAGAGFIAYNWSTGATTRTISAGPGNYSVTVTNSHACTGTAVATVSEASGFQTTVNASICDNESYLFNSQNLTAAGAYLDTLQASNGCDSIITLNLSVLPTSKATLNEIICEGSSFAFNGQNLAATGTYAATFPAANGCDSVVTLNLTVLPNATASMAVSICDGEVYPFDGQGLTAPGTYTATFPAANGCDSVVTLNLTVLPNAAASMAASICDGEVYPFDGQGLTAPGTYTATFTAANGCDSVVALNLTVFPVALTNLSQVICQGQNYFFDGQFLTVAGTYSDTLAKVNGCDSIVALNLAVLPLAQSSFHQEICEGETYFYDGQSYSQPGTYSITFAGANGCDSIVTLFLDLLPPSSSAITTGICAGESYNFHGTVLTNSGNYVDTLSAANGCDSIVSLSLSVIAVINSNITEVICSGDSLFFAGQFLTTPGVYQDTLLSAGGCDSIVTLNLAMQQVQQFQLQDTICAGGAYNFFGQTLTAAGTYTHVFSYTTGCDSAVYALHLVVDANCNPIFDLALRKTRAVGQQPSAMLGDTVAFTIQVFNQGALPAYQVQVLDYLPAGFTYDGALNPGWFDFGGGPSWFINGPLLPGDSVSQDILLVVNANAAVGALVNYAEITGADDDTNGNNAPPTDQDSNPDALPGNDAGGQPASPADDEINGDGTGAPGDGNPATDEDDHDGEAIEFIPMPLLSLGNLVFSDFDNDGIFNNNDSGIGGVEVELYGAGPDGLKGTADDALLAADTTGAAGEYLFSGLSEGVYFVKLNGTGIPAGFASSTGDGPFDSDGAGAFEPSALGDMNGTDHGTQMGVMVMSNLIELTAFGEPVDDGDSDPNTNLTVDFGLYSVTSTVYDLALTKDLAPGQTMQVNLGEDINYLIQVVNQGNQTAYHVTVHDMIPEGLVLSPADTNGWTLAGPDLAAHVFPDSIAPGDTASVYILLRLHYAQSGANLANTAEVTAVDNSAGDPLPDVDSQPDNQAPGEDDMDTAFIELLPHDPTGYIYCDKTGKIITGGTIAVTGPGQVTIVADGSSGYYEFFTDGTPGVYNLSYSHPAGYPMSSKCLPSPGPFDPTNLPNPVILGSDTLGMYLADTSCAANPYFMSFDLAPGDPIILKNNLPVQCVFIGSIVCEDTNLNDTMDIGDQLLPGVAVSLYNCADTLNPIMATVTDSLGHYAFDGLTPGNYKVRFLIPPGVRPVASSAIGLDGCSNCLSLNWGDCDTTASVCLYQCPALNAGPDLAICVNDTILIDAGLSHGNGSINWTPSFALSDPASAVTLAYPLSPTDYVVNYDDGLGCATSDTLFIDVQISTPYLVYTPANFLPVNCGGPIPYDPPVFGDDCDSNLFMVFDSTSTPQGCSFIITRNWIVWNDYGKTATFTQIVEVTDDTPPQLVGVPANVQVSCGSVPPPANVAATDNCDPNVPVLFTEVIFSDSNCVMQLVRSWIATDACGNAAQATQVITMQDNQNPVITPINPALVNLALGDTIYLDCQGVAAMSTADVMVTDDCCPNPDVIFMEVASPMVNCLTNGYIQTMNCTWMATDCCGNVSTFYIVVVVVDNLPPKLYTVPHDLTIGCTGTVPPPPPVYAVDNCDNNMVVSFNEVENGDTIVRTWSASDDCGHTTTQSQTIILTGAGNTPPVILNVPVDTVVNCASNIPPPAANVVAWDNCDPVPSLVQADSIAGTGCPMTVFRRWTATNSAGFSSTAVQIITVADTIAPVLSGMPADLTLSCGDAIPAAVFPAVTDNCDSNIQVQLVELVNSQDSCDIVLDRIFSAADACGNQTSLHQFVHIVDVAGPEIVVTHPALLNVSSGDTLVFQCNEVPVLAGNGAFATDACDANPSIYYTQNIIDSAYCNGAPFLLLMRIGWVATDHCGNQTEWLVYFKVIDTLPPVIAGQLPTGTLVNCGAVPPMPSLAGFAATDNCGGNVVLQLTETLVPGSCGGNYQLVRMLTATDACGNAASQIQTIEVKDLTPPQISGVPADTTVECGSIPPPAQVLVTDNCDSAPVVTVNDSHTNGCPYTIFRTWTATDECGNSLSRTQRLTVVDNFAPEFSQLPPDTVAGCTSVPAAPVLTAIDNCSANVVVTFDEVVNDTGCPYTILRTWTATDNCGNTATYTQTVTVYDTGAPAFILPPDDLTVECGNVPAPATLQASDSCDPSPVVTFSETQAGSCPATILRTWTATDNCGNAFSFTQSITVEDTQPPVFSNEPVDTVISCGSPIPFGQPLFSDNCDTSLVLLYSEVIDSTVLCHRVITRAWVGVDNCGNHATVVQTIHVIDDQPPVIVFVHPLLTGLTDGDTLVMPCDAVEVFGVSDAVATDLCNDATLAFTEGSVSVGNCANDGFLLSKDCTWTATDICGNTATVMLHIFIVDNTAPAFTGVPVDTTINCGDAVPPFAAAAANDNCGQVLVSVVQDTVVANAGYDLVRVYTATDGCGNAAVVSQIIHVVDTGVPVLAGVPADTIIYPNQGGVVPGPANVTAVDGCTGQAVAVNFAETINLVAGGGCDTLIQRTWTATDAFGNAASASQNIIVAGGYNVSWSTSPEICGFANGAASLSPDTLDYTWSDGGNGAARNNLSAGDYLVFATDGGCTDTLVVTIGNVCPCFPPVLDSLSLTDATCGNADGAAAIQMLGNPEYFTYLWMPNLGTPNATDNARADLPAGNYVVIAEWFGQDSCFAKLEFTIGDDCPQCAPVFSQDTMTVDVASDPANVCLAVPYAVSQYYDIYVNGNLYTQAPGLCQIDSVIFYTYALVAGQGNAGPYSVVWEHHNDTLFTSVNNMNDLVAAMNAVDTAGMWYNNPGVFGFTSMNVGGNCGNLFITHDSTQVTAQVQPNFITTPMGTELMLPAGVNQVVYVNPANGCTDTLIVGVIYTPLTGGIFGNRFSVVSANCDYEDPGICLGIPYDDLAGYDFELNGQPFNGTFGICDYVADHYYSYAALPGWGIEGPYHLEDWAVDGQHFAAPFQTVDELVGLMNQWDSNGNWVLDTTTFTILGGVGLGTYGDLQISQVYSGAFAQLQLNTNLAPGSAKVTLPDGDNSFVVRRLSDDFRDTLRAMVACVTPDYFKTVVKVNQKDTLCLSLDELLGEVASVEEVCGGGFGNAAQFGMIPGTSCVLCLGAYEGKAEACFVVCDEFGICDTTYLSVEVRAGESTNLMADTLVTVANTPVNEDVLANDVINGGIVSMQIVRAPLHGSVVVNPDFSVTYRPEAGYCNSRQGVALDNFFYEVCTSEGCSTMIVWVEVRCDDFIIFNGFSPNGDGVNDFFRIQGLEKYPLHALHIFNRWGNKVFSTKHYENDWGGSWGQNDLPDGTYFYLFEDGEGHSYNGYIEIRR
ncbi:MAG: T9SS type B sorting domain-containing protein [Saprospiraceae bacterium]|nr:MAG: T9SS type B sorting domain-containing protein [Saprospiraceae bacterium]